MKPDYYEFFCPVKILSGRKALANLPHELTQLGSKNPLIITDKGVAGAKLLDKVQAALTEGDMPVGAIYDEVPPDSGNRVVNEVARLYQDKACDSIVAVGGGSVIDTAKGVNIVVSEGTDDLLKFQGVDRIKATMQPFVVIPTTAGTGSEATAAAVIANQEKGMKMALVSNRLYPHVALIDPVMMLTMPAKITAATGMDALTHACEAFYCLQKNPVSDAFAASAIRLIRDNLVEATRNGENEDARIAMADAALLAGIAFSNSMVGAVHSMAHACGGVAHVPHGVANSILLPFGIEYNMENVPEYLAEIAEMLVPDLDPKLSVKEKAQKAADGVRALSTQLAGISGLPQTLSEAGVKEDQLEAIAKLAIDDGSLTYNPAEATFDEILTVLKKAF